MKRKEKRILFFLTVLVLGAVLYSSNRLLFNSLLTWQLQQTPYLLMLGELALLFILLLTIGLFLSPKAKVISTMAVLSIFLWLHQLFLPIVVSGLYVVWLWLCGRWLCRRVIARNPACPPHAFSSEPLGKAFRREFLTGSLFTICAFCLMSAFGIGKIENLWIYLFDVTTILALDWRFWKSQKAELTSSIASLTEKTKTIKQKAGLPAHQTTLKLNSARWKNALFFAVLLTLFGIQAGRMNISVDFDSIWYGTRSPYILNNGGGIYENLGTIGVVYTYSKGLEVLTLPLSILPSYSFVIAFNFWLAAGVLMQSWIMGKRYLTTSSVRLMLCFIAALPGIMNMSITAKSDMATLYLQMIMIDELLCLLQGEGPAFWYAWAAFFFSWTLKPTAMVFSTAIMGMSILYFLFLFSKSRQCPPSPRTDKTAVRQNRQVILLESHRASSRLFNCKETPYPNKPRSRRSSANTLLNRRRAIVTFILSLIALTGLWARTFLITGLPVTSVFSSVLTRLGFTMKYPFNAKAIPNNTAGVTALKRLCTALNRIYGVLFNPQGDDMDHVIIAWGSLGAWFLLCLFLAWIFLGKKSRTSKERRLDGFLNTIFLPLVVCCLISLIMLYQVDGNYFMLFYVLSALCIFRLAERLSSQSAARIIHGLCIPVILFSILITTLTNWAWSLGFTPIAWKHRGYYPHQQIQHQEMSASGNGQIWEILSQNPRNRLISIGAHPQSLVFPCNAQSFRDITKNAWGNPVLAETMDNFVEFMDYAKTDYIYVQAGYLSPEGQTWDLLCACIIQGKVIPLCFEAGNMLAYVDVQGVPDEECSYHLEEFMANYQHALPD